MDQCKDMASLLTAWVDGSIDPAGAARVASHVDTCRACAARATTERAARRLLHDRRDALTAERAPEALVARLQSMRPASTSARRASLRLPVAVAATLVLALSGVTLHVATGRSTTVLAAQLAADHAKCHLTEHVEHGLDAGAARDRLAIRYGFHAVVPPGTSDGRLELVGARRCLTGDGTIAHILYRFAGQPVSLFMLPKSSHSEEIVRVLGHEAAIWSVGDRTFVLIARVTRDEVEHMAAFIQSTLR